MDDIIIYLQLLYHSTFLPVHYYRRDQCLLVLPNSSPEYDLAAIYRKPLLDKGTGIDYVSTDDFLHYGIVRNLQTDEYIIAGPVTPARIRAQALPHILNDSSISLDYMEKVKDFLQMTPLFTFDQFICLLSILYKELNGKLINPLSYFENVSVESISAISEKHSLALFQANEEQLLHNTYHFEQELFRCVENGDSIGLQKIYQKTPWLQAGKTSENSLRQEKNIFIASITLLTRHSIAGGLDIETAYQLSDTYIQSSEKAQTVDEISRLSLASIKDFTARVAACKIPAGMSTEIYQCIRYISSHINQPVSVDDVADSVGKSRSHISRQFKKELGFNLSDYIMRRKLEEGKSLLAYSDKSLSEISEYLCFSSQSYFQNVFKKKYGVTPMEYRKANRR